MYNYDYREGKMRIREILNRKENVIENDMLPADENAFTFDNSYYSRITAVFVDIRDSTPLFNHGDKIMVSKIVRCFTSEAIEILRHGVNLREIGIRGDCVYSIYATPTPHHVWGIVNRTFLVNTFIEMLNELIFEKGYPDIYVGIGVSTARELVMKAGRKNSGINSTVWIGDAVTKASKLSSLGDKDGIGPLVYSETSYDDFIEIENQRVRRHMNRINYRGKFTENYSDEYGYFYHGDIVNAEFDDWINNGMQTHRNTKFEPPRMINLF